MAGYERLRDELVGRWRSAREGLIEEVEQLTEAQLDHALADGARTPREIARHVAESGAPLAGMALGTEITAAEESPRDPGALLRASWKPVEDGLSSMDPETLGEAMTGVFGESTTRLSFLYFCYAHEMYHRGQVALAARAQGVIPALTRRLEDMRSG